VAVIWQKTQRGTQYEVRAAGQTRRLYTNGVFHSQYNPNRQLTGNVWDLLSLPSFFLEAHQIRRVLVLGVGGGAVIRQLLNWYPRVEIVGVELDSTHISISKRFFGLNHKRVCLIEANAISWLKSYRGVAFDIVIDDLFGDVNGEPERVITANADWVKELAGNLSPHGMLVMNFTESKDYRSNAVFHDKVLQKKFKMVYRFTTPLYENNMAVMLQTPCKTNQWRKRILAVPELNSEYRLNQDKIKLRKIAG